MNPIQFEIDQLRKDKIIYAIESCATSLGAMVLLLLSTVLARSLPFLSNIAILIALFALGYLVYMGIGNARRLMKIRQLEKKL